MRRTADNIGMATSSVWKPVQSTKVAKSWSDQEETAARLPAQSGAGSAREASGCDLAAGRTRRLGAGLRTYAVASPQAGPLLYAAARTWRGFPTPSGRDSRPLLFREF